MSKIDVRVWQFLVLCASDGIDARLVGGAVRDVLFYKKTTKNARENRGSKSNGRNGGNDVLGKLDFDVAVDGSPDEMICFCKKHHIAFFPTGIDHGTLTVRFKKLTLELTSLRADIETDGRHATVVFGKSFEEDAKRRDFTFNALYVDHLGNIYDYFDGVNDLKKGIMRFIGDAHLRICEDYLRLYRYFRFWGQFGRGAVDLSVLPSLNEIKNQLSILSIERVQREFFKVLEQSWPWRIIESMRGYGLLNALFESDINFEKNVTLFRKLVIYEHACGLAPCVMRRLAALMNGKDVQAPFKLSRINQQKLTFLIQQHHINDVAFLKPEFYVDAALLALPHSKESVFQNIKQSKRLKPLPEFPLTGADVVTCGVPEGKEIGMILKKIKKLWIESNFVWDRDHALNVLLSFIRPTA
ncbi:MAG: hypothetical protein Q8S21_06685 [Candidatus Paracaedibacteraceae bacterium]|nr:hypothetical protein [Candidatus Paracaedibacteraceae bacterium]